MLCLRLSKQNAGNYLVRETGEKFRTEENEDENPESRKAKKNSNGRWRCATWESTQGRRWPAILRSTESGACPVYPLYATTALEQANDKQNDGYDQEDVQHATQGVTGNQTQQPQDQQNYR